MKASSVKYQVSSLVDSTVKIRLHPHSSIQDKGHDEPVSLYSEVSVLKRKNVYRYGRLQHNGSA